MFICWFVFSLIIWLKFRLATCKSSSSSSNLSSSTASSVEIYTVMGLFNTGKNDKIEKVEKYEKYEEENDASPSKGHRRSSKHPSKKPGPIIRQMPQSSMMPFNGNYFTPNFQFPPQSGFSNFSQFKYGYPSNPQYDLSKYIPSSVPFNPYLAGQTPATNFAPVWSNGISPFTDRSPFQQQQQQPLNMYQQNGWPYFPPSTNGYMPPMNF